LAGADAVSVYAENAAALVLDGALTFTDPDVPADSVQSGTVSISSGFVAGDLLVASTTGTAISANWNAGTHVLNLTGTDTLAHYEQVMESVTYFSSSDNPTAFGTSGTRTLSYQV